MVMPEVLFRDLMNNTVFNYEFIKCRATDQGPFEVTQLVNSFVMVAGLPRERDIHAGLEGIGIERARTEFGLPELADVASHADYGIRHMADLAGMFRNAVAHGNIAFNHSHDSKYIETIRLSDRRTRKSDRAMQHRSTNWLSTDEIERILYAFQRIANHLYEVAVKKTA